MSFLPEGASFEELVQDYFVAFRGSGLMLSPLDGELVSEWGARGVPFEVVARGIRRAAEAALWDARPGEPVLRSVRACRRAVEAEINKYLDRAAGASGGEAAAALEEDRERKRARALQKLARERPEVAALVERAAGAAARMAPERREEAVLILAARFLPYPRRVAVVREARAQGQAAEALSARARRLARRFHLTAAVRRALQLPAFW